MTSSNTDSCQDDEDEITPPLFVTIQTIDLHNLDFQTNIGSSAKFRHLTYIEATNLFLFVGSTSGTIYVFSRDTLKFLFIIPFKGGKVCSIACSQDESDIAVGSIRGKVSIYRISPNVHYMQSSASVPLIDAFRDIYDVPHHTTAEITEMQWSPNGKYLFVGDSQGIVSQMDVACLDEFPRPIPSKIILKLQSRILQIDCSFPYLTVCTLAAVFLCDLEKEDFTRVQCTKNTDIRSAGLCLMILPERSSIRDLAKERTIPSAKLILFVGEAGTGVIHCCNMEGSVQQSKKVLVSSKVSKYPMPLFDPTKTTSAGNGTGYFASCDERVNISLGKMLCTDDGMIVSVSSDRLYVYDPHTLNVIAWNDGFKRINNFKIISNYAFIWAGNKLEVVAFTPFRSYAEQLFRAKLHGVLESWIVHTVYALGWRKPSQSAHLNNASVHELATTDDETAENNTLHDASSHSSNGDLTNSSHSTDHNVELAIENMRKMILSEGEEETEFTQFVISQLPFPLKINNGLQHSPSSESPAQNQTVADVELESVKTIEKPVRRFLKEVQSVLLLTAVSASNGSSLSTLTDNHSDNHDNNARISSTLSRVLKKCGRSDFFESFMQVWKALLLFYEDIECTLPQLDYKISDLTLSHVLHASQCFLSQPKLVNLHKEIAESGNLSKFEDLAILMISSLHCQQEQFKKCVSELSTSKISAAAAAAVTPAATNNSFNLCFTKFAHCPLVKQWFRDLGTSPETLFYDGLIADTLLLLLPFVTDPANKNDTLLLTVCLDSVGIYDKLTTYFMTWLFLCKFLYKPKQVPYSPLLRTMLNDQLFEKLAEEMFSTIYRDFRLSSFNNAAHYLHHFVSAVVLLSKSPGCSHPRNVSILLTCFPLLKWAREDIVTKIIAACHLNKSLLSLYLKACLEDGNSMKLCGCGLQAGFGTLEDKVSSWQKAIEEAIIKLLLEEYFKSSPFDDNDDDDSISYQEPDGNGNGPQKRKTEVLVHMFAMRRGLLEPYFRSPLADEFLSEERQAELIIRSGSCPSLKYYQCNEQNMSLLLRCYEQHFRRTSPPDFHQVSVNGFENVSSKSMMTDANNKCSPHGRKGKDSRRADICGNGLDERKCSSCSLPLHIFKKNFKPISRDCLGLWALKHVGTLDRLIEIVENCQLNVPAVFSTRFYRAVLKFSERTHKRGLNEYDGDFNGESSSLSCTMFH